MREWSELEDRYQQMMASDPAAAQTFRQRMTAKFQSNIQVFSINTLKISKREVYGRCNVILEDKT